MKLDRYYKILGLKNGASLHEVEKKYLILSKEYNPNNHQDKNLKDFFEKQNKEVFEAYKKIKSNQIESENSKSFFNKKIKLQNVIFFFLISFLFIFLIDYIQNFKSSLYHSESILVKDVFGCTNSKALNFDSLANIDDGSCLFAVYGCLDSNAYNFNPLATVDNSSCKYSGCTDVIACNFGIYAISDNSFCIYNSGNAYNILLEGLWNIDVTWDASNKAINSNKYENQKFLINRTINGSFSDFKWSICSDVFKMTNKSNTTTYSGVFYNGEIIGAIENSIGNTGKFSIKKVNRLDDKLIIEKPSQNELTNKSSLMLGRWKVYYSWNCVEIAHNLTGKSISHLTEAENYHYYNKNGTFGHSYGDIHGTWTFEKNVYSHTVSNGTTYNGKFNDGIIIGNMKTANGKYSGCFKLIKIEE